MKPRSDKTKRFREYLLLFGTFFIYSVSGIFAKVASKQGTIPNMLIFLGLEFVVLGVYALAWQQILKKFPLTVAMACKGITVVYAIGWAVFLFGENITVCNIVGAILVVFGIGVASSDG